jgi:hypothetical protein
LVERISAAGRGVWPDSGLEAGDLYVNELCRCNH